MMSVLLGGHFNSGGYSLEYCDKYAFIKWVFLFIKVVSGIYMCATVGVILVGDFSLGTRVLLVLNV
jgi:hypothetical protein